VSLLVRVEQGDISTFQGDAVVNAANNHLRMGAGVAGALYRSGGHAIQEECDQLVRTHGPLEVGDAAITGAGALQVRWVIHAAAMGDLSPSEESIRSATRRSLALAAGHEVDSLAFPVLGTGVGGFGFEEAARLMLEEIRAHGETSERPGIVVMYGFTETDAATLRRLVERA
jgi:O-acetyl-ADP-ribose deacetylase (regulator of RNase III)